MGDKGDRQGTSILQLSSLLLAIRKRCHPKCLSQGPSLVLSLFQDFTSARSGALKDLARLLRIFFFLGGVRCQDNWCLKVLRISGTEESPRDSIHCLLLHLKHNVIIKASFTQYKTILPLVPLMQTQTWEPASLTGLTIFSQPVFLSVVPWVRPFLFIGKFFRQYPSDLLTQTSLTISCGCSCPAKSPCPGCYSSCSYLYYLGSYMLLSKLRCYWFPSHCWIWFSVAFDLMLFFCSSYCLCFCPQYCVGWFSKNASHDIETKKECCHSRYTAQTLKT